MQKYKIELHELIGDDIITLNKQTRSIKWFIIHRPAMVAAVIISKETPKDLRNKLKICFKEYDDYKEFIEKAKEERRIVLENAVGTLEREH